MIVTGASSGIGRALAERAARAGWNVFAVGRRTERLDELQRAVAGATGTIATATLELRDLGAPARIVRETIARFGRIDVVVNNAGAVAVGPIGQQTDDELREQFETHAIVPLALTREALDELRRNRGAVVVVGSGVARVPIGGLGAYPPAKAAVRNFARVLRNELRPLGVAVTYVDPGAVATEFMTRAGLSGPPPRLAASPYEVARRILVAIERRRSVVNAVPWQTAVVALGELVPGLTDFVLARVPQIAGVKAVRKPTAQPPPAPAPAPPVAPFTPTAIPETPVVADVAELELSPFEAALKPVASRMRRSNLSVIFVSGLLVPGTTLEPGEVALQWTGMPNKHERDLTHEVLEALAGAGFLTRLDDERYRVVKSAETTA
jgi:short-subunit dehydrogenase